MFISKQFHTKPIVVPHKLLNKALTRLHLREKESLVNDISRNEHATHEQNGRISRILQEVLYGGINRGSLVYYLHVVLLLSAESHLSAKVLN